jgi:hypothetical protein
VAQISWEGHLLAICVGAMFGSWEADIVQLKAAGVGATSGAGSASAGTGKSESGASSEKAPLTSDDLHEDDLHDAEVGAGGVSGAK